ncbi:hypothetical protein GCM10023159_19290 [Brevibacterium yomogidense]
MRAVFQVSMSVLTSSAARTTGAPCFAGILTGIRHVGDLYPTKRTGFRRRSVGGVRGCRSSYRAIHIVAVREQGSGEVG